MFSKNKYNDVKVFVSLIKQEYLFGHVDENGNKVFQNLKDLCEKYNVSYNTLRKNYSIPEKWRDEKKIVQSRVQEKSVERRTELEAMKIVQIDNEYETAFRTLRKLTVDTIAKKKAGKIRGIDLFHYANTLITCYEGEKVAHGESLEQNDNSGWDALAKVFEKPQEPETKES